ncbi:MAG: SDR family NAD(P)-dependent oxidoreductase [Acidiferrobacteraceae bacterium]|jgi:short-subunit dehydrogenase
MGKKVLITGARGGFGLEAALMLARRGHEVIATVHHEKNIATVEAAASAAGVSLAVEKRDILVPHDREAMLAHEPDVLVNNAAVGESGPLVEVPPERIRGVVETNVFATIYLTQACLRAMIDRGHGTVVIVSSLGGRLAMPMLGPYVMTKFALEAAVDALRLELRPFPVDISLIEPGAHATGFNEKMQAKKYEWMGADSRYRDHMKTVHFWEQVTFRTQMENLAPVARQVVRAVEARRPRARYATPWWQGLGVRVLRAFGW